MKLIRNMVTVHTVDKSCSDKLSGVDKMPEQTSVTPPDSDNLLRGIRTAADVRSGEIQVLPAFSLRGRLCLSCHK